MTEQETKLARVRAWLAAEGYEGALFRRRASFSWLTCGGNATVERGVEGAVVDLVVTRDDQYVVASEIERYRILDEELGGAPGFELVTYPWGNGAAERALDALRAGRRMASDLPAPGFDPQPEALAALRYVLTPEEAERARAVAREASASFEAVCRTIEPGMTELDVAARLSERPIREGGDAPVALVAFDERMARYRHPAPTARKLRRRALLGRCSGRNGLIISLSRIVSFGPPDDDLLRRHEACARVNAAFIAATIPGATGREVFAKGRAAYAAAGFPDEWRFHHQGGALGYRCRDWIADEACADVVHEGQLFSWNPTIAGTKVEDTVLVRRDGFENLTETAGWPAVETWVGGVLVRSPAILVR